LNTVICKIEAEIGKRILKVNATEIGCKNIKVTLLTQNTVPYGTQIMRKINFGFHNYKTFNHFAMELDI
jgi:hypothetical protein